MKRFCAALVALLMCVAVIPGCIGGNGNDNGGGTVNQGQTGEGSSENSGTQGGGSGENTGNQPGEDSGNNTPGGDLGEEETVKDWMKPLSDSVKDNLSADGFVNGVDFDFSEYVGTDAYRVVTTVDELVSAIEDAKYHYKNNWDEASGTYTQTPADGYTQENFKGKVHIIEIANDLDLGYNKLSAAAKEKASVVESFCRNKQTMINNFTMSDMFLEYGISQFKIENCADLLIYSKNGATLRHGGFKITSGYNIAVRNLNFDEMWQWEDAPSTSVAKVGDYDAFGWAYFKISFSENIWIDHCSFGKSYDGQIDYSNPVYDADAGTAFRAPYGATGNNGLHVSWCSFNAGSDDKDGYLYKMMQSIEENYQANKSDPSIPCKYLYYKALRDAGMTFEDVLYALAIPQKKGFLCGDSGDKYSYNLKLRVSFANCKFKNLEDRIPKLRGGIAYVYNCIVDNMQYYTYRNGLRGYAGAVIAVNSSWKCAFVSQGIVCGNGGSVMAENCIFKGIQYLLKNNDSGNDGSKDGGYYLKNCSFKQSGSSPEIVASSESSNPFNAYNASPDCLTTSNFSWHTENGEAPFTVSVVELSDLAAYLDNEDYGAGTRAKFQEKLLKSDYTA